MQFVIWENVHRCRVLFAGLLAIVGFAGVFITVLQETVLASFAVAESTRRSAGAGAVFVNCCMSLRGPPPWPLVLEQWASSSESPLWATRFRLLTCFLFTSPKSRACLGAQGKAPPQKQLSRSWSTRCGCWLSATASAGKNRPHRFPPPHFLFPAVGHPPSLDRKKGSWQGSQALCLLVCAWTVQQSLMQTTWEIVNFLVAAFKVKRNRWN